MWLQQCHTECSLAEDQSSHLQKQYGLLLFNIHTNEQGMMRDDSPKRHKNATPSPKNLVTEFLAYMYSNICPKWVNYYQLQDTENYNLHGWETESQNSSPWVWQDPNFAVQAQLKVPAHCNHLICMLWLTAMKFLHVPVTWNSIRCDNKPEEPLIQ